MTSSRPHLGQLNDHARNEGPGGCVPWDHFQTLMDTAKSFERERSEAYRVIEDAIDDMQAGCTEAALQRLINVLPGEPGEP